MPQYLVELCQPVAGVASREHLRSATQQLLVVPRHQLSSYGRWAFCEAGPSVWNSLPDSLWNPIIGGNSFRQSLKTFLFATYWCIQRIKGFPMMRYINQLFTYLLTYFWWISLNVIDGISNRLQKSMKIFIQFVARRLSCPKLKFLLVVRWHQKTFTFATSCLSQTHTAYMHPQFFRLTSLVYGQYFNIKCNIFHDIHV